MTDPTDTQDSEAIQHMRAALEARDTELTALRAEKRANEVRSILGDLKAPPNIAEIFPADAPVTKEGVSAFLKDKIGLDPDGLEAWNRYDKVANGREGVAAPEDEEAKWIATELKNTADFYRKTTLPTEAETKALEELKSKVFRNLEKWDTEVANGHMGPLVTPQGFGGLLDPPAYAVRARFHSHQVN